MNDGLRYALGSLGGILVLFGAFLVCWRRLDRHAAAARERTGAWLILLAGAGLLAASLLISSPPPPEVPPFLRR